MSEGRERILGDIRAALKRSGPVVDSVRDALAQRIDAPRANVRPAYDAPPVERFIEKLRAVNGIVTRVDSLVDVASAVESHVERFSLPFELVVAPDPALDDIPWSNRFQVERRAALGTDRVSVTGSFAGIGETGTLVLLSGAQSPTTLNFLPDDHLVVLREHRVVANMEDVWSALRKEHHAMPRTVNLITGPSKTADVEQVMQEGAHGPRRLHVLLVRD